MTDLVHELVFSAASGTPEAQALVSGKTSFTYAALADEIHAMAAGFIGLGLQKFGRVAVYLDKRPETVIALFAACAAGGVMVPINPLLKPDQVAHILADCNAGILVTSSERLAALAAALPRCPDLKTVILAGPAPETTISGAPQVLDWERASKPAADGIRRGIDGDMAAILYTSGSTGRPKGVVLSHRNLVAGAKSVASYLENTAGDRILCALPFSFDYGLSQLTTAFHVGACAMVMNYLLPRDIMDAVIAERITGLAAVPPLWNQLARLSWPQDCSLRYLTNSGGAMPQATLTALRQALPRSKIYLMYGLTEAFRSTYLPPAELDRRPDSIGRAIPNAEVMVVRPDGSPCAPHEHGELVHRGALVALGYWNDPEKTAERFRPAPGLPAGLPQPELAVWSGDTVSMDEDGFLYFIGRQDDMIKVSGYRVSPTEIEEVVASVPGVAAAIALGVPHPQLGQGIVVIVESAHVELSSAALLAECKRRLPAYMVPAHIALRRESLPRNPNGKFDRPLLKAEFADFFAKTSPP